MNNNPPLVVYAAEVILPVVVRLPLLATVNTDLPEAEAAIKSPLPDWSMTKAAKEVLPEMEATGVMPDNKEL